MNRPGEGEGRGPCGRGPPEGRHARHTGRPPANRVIRPSAPARPDRGLARSPPRGRSPPAPNPRPFVSTSVWRSNKIKSYTPRARGRLARSTAASRTDSPPRGYTPGTQQPRKPFITAVANQQSIGRLTSTFVGNQR